MCGRYLNTRIPEQHSGVRPNQDLASRPFERRTRTRPIGGSAGRLAVAVHPSTVIIMFNGNANTLNDSGTTLRRMLVVEDMAIVAVEIERLVRELGWEVIGPLQTLDEAMRMAREARIDAAMLDVNLRGQMVFPAADILLERGIPMLFVTGYSCEMLPARFRSVPCLVKPFTIEHLSRMLEMHCGDIADAARALGNPAAAQTVSSAPPHDSNGQETSRNTRADHSESPPRRLPRSGVAARKHVRDDGAPRLGR